MAIGIQVLWCSICLNYDYEVPVSSYADIVLFGRRKDYVCALITIDICISNHLLRSCGLCGRIAVHLEYIDIFMFG